MVNAGAWLKEHVMNNHGALGDIYPERRFRPRNGAAEGHLGFMEGGGTLPWMGLVNKGLFDIDHPHWGGWSGRYSRNKVPCFWSRHGDIRVDEEKAAPFYTYRELNDYWIDPANGDTLKMSAVGSNDPDNDPVEIKWWQYLEAGTHPGKVLIPHADQINTFIVMPTGAAGKQIHIILEIRDKNKTAAFYDYRRIVIDVADMYNHNVLFKQKS